MTTLTNKQQGSSHVILTVVLVVVIVGLLGFIFWQNFVKKDEAANANNTGGTSEITPVEEREALAEEMTNKDLMSSDGFGIKYQVPASWTGGTYGGGSTLSDTETTTFTSPDGLEVTLTISRLARGWSPEDPTATVLETQTKSDTLLKWVVVADDSASKAGSIQIQGPNQNLKTGDQKLAGTSIYKLGEVDGSGVYLEIVASYDGESFELSDFTNKDGVKQAKALFESITLYR